MSLSEHCACATDRLGLLNPCVPPAAHLYFVGGGRFERVRTEFPRTPGGLFAISTLTDSGKTIFMKSGNSVSPPSSVLGSEHCIGTCRRAASWCQWVVQLVPALYENTVPMLSPKRQKAFSKRLGNLLSPRRQKAFFKRLGNLDLRVVTIAIFVVAACVSVASILLSQTLQVGGGDVGRGGGPGRRGLTALPGQVMYDMSSGGKPWIGKFGGKTARS